MRCILCGKKISNEKKKPSVVKRETSPYDDPFADLYDDTFETRGEKLNQADKPEHSKEICDFCRAKLKSEADDSQKIPKPM